jgi:hypothetical protein
MSSSALYGLVLFSAAAHASWNSLVQSAGDRVLTMVTIRFTGLVLGLAALPFVDWPRSDVGNGWLSRPLYSLDRRHGAGLSSVSRNYNRRRDGRSEVHNGH